MAANVSSARGRIEDADYAMETTNLTKKPDLAARLYVDVVAS